MNKVWSREAALPVVVAVAMLFPLSLSSQLEEERESTVSLEALEEQVERAKDLFFSSADAMEPLQEFSRLLELLEARQPVGGERMDRVEKLIVEVLGYRTQLNINLNRLDLVDTDVRRILKLDPGYEYDPAQVSPTLIERFETLRNLLVGFVDLQVVPADASVWVNGAFVDLTSGHVVALELESLGGGVEIAAERPGYRAIREVLSDVPAGRTTLYKLSMERVGPSFRLETVPTGASVTIDGGELGKIEGRSPLWVGLKPGKYVLEISLEGYRKKAGELSFVDSLDHSRIERLDRTGGIVTLQPFLQGEELRVDDEETFPTSLSKDRAQVELPPGEHRVLVRGAAGTFEVTIQLRDRELMELEVEKRPAVSLLGILGGDRVAAEQLRKSLLRARSGLKEWMLLDRSEGGLALLQHLGLGADRLRFAADTGRVLESDIDWRTVQTRASSLEPASVFLLAVLSDDLLASEADLWFLPALPGPASPDFRRVRLAEPRDLAGVLSDLDQPLELRRLWLGALLIDSDAAGGPVVVSVDPNSPAATTGIQIGDELIAIAGKKPGRVEDAQALLEAAPQNAPMDLVVQRSGRHQTLRLKLGSSPIVIGYNDPGLIYAAVAARLSTAASRASLPNWLRQLNLGMVFLKGGAWKEALREFRTADGFPEDQGLGQAAADYWLGVCLEALGPEYYAEARAAFRKAAAAPGGRLYHNDGPFIAPRARARLAELGSED